MRSSTFDKAAVLLFFVSSLLSFGGEAYAASEESPLTISCILVNDENYVGMPLPVEVVVSNVSDRAVVLSSGERPDIIFTSENGSTRRKPPRVTGLMKFPLTLSSKSNKYYVYHPSRSIKFSRAGEVRLNYEITLRYRYLDEADNHPPRKEEKVSGVLEFKLKPSDPVETKKFLDKEMERFESDDIRIKADVAESVCFMDDASTLDYIKEIARNKSTPVQLIVLESIWYNECAEADKILLEMLQPDGNDQIIQIVFGLLYDRDIEISRQTMEALLASGNSRIRSLALSSIKKENLGDYLDWVRDLVNDENEEISVRATEIIAEFEGSEP